MSEEILTLNLGIQPAELQLATQQIVYLDFDGAETSYHNRDLNLAIDNLQIEDSGFETADITVIVIFVTVSASGTGKTLSSFIISLLYISNGI